MLTQADATFRHVIGNSYYLYERDDGTTFVSLIAPREWSWKEYTFTFVTTVVATADQEWETVFHVTRSIDFGG